MNCTGDQDNRLRPQDAEHHVKPQLQQRAVDSAERPQGENSPKNHSERDSEDRKPKQALKRKTSSSSSSTRKDCSSPDSVIDPLKTDENRNSSSGLSRSATTVDLSWPLSSLSEKVNERRALITRMMGGRNADCDSTIDNSLDILSSHSKNKGNQVKPGDLPEVVDVVRKLAFGGETMPAVLSNSNSLDTQAAECPIGLDAAGGGVGSNKQRAVGASTKEEKKLSGNELVASCEPDESIEDDLDHDNNSRHVQPSENERRSTSNYTAAPETSGASIYEYGVDHNGSNGVSAKDPACSATSDELEASMYGYGDNIAPDSAGPGSRDGVFRSDSNRSILAQQTRSARLRRSSLSNISIEVSVDAETPGDKRRTARRSSVSTVSISFDFDQSMKSSDQNEALLNLINHAVSNATSEAALENTTIQRKASDLETEDGFDNISVLSSGSTLSQQRRSTMSHMRSRPHLQPPLAWLNGDTTPDVGSHPAQPAEVPAITTKVGTSSRRFEHNGARSAGMLSRSAHENSYRNSRDHSHLRHGTSFRHHSAHETSFEHRRQLTIETSETRTETMTTSCSMHNIGMHNRYGFMVDDKQAQRARRRCSVGWGSSGAEKQSDPPTTNSSTRPILNRCSSVGGDILKTMKQKPVLKRQTSRRLSRGVRPPMAKANSSRSFMARSQMTRQTSTRSISRVSVGSSDDKSCRQGSRRGSALSRDDKSCHQGSRRGSALSRAPSSRSIAKMTVVYQETSNELQAAFDEDELSASVLGDESASFAGPSSDDCMSAFDQSIDDCMSAIGETIQEVDEIQDVNEKKKRLNKRSPSMKSLYSFKSIKSLGKKLGLAKKKKKTKEETGSPQVTKRQDSAEYNKENKVQGSNESTQHATGTVKRSVSDILSFRIGKKKALAKPEPWMMLQTDAVESHHWTNHQDAKMLNPYGVQEVDETRARRMRRRASM